MIQQLGERLLSDLIIHYQTEQPYYVGDRLAYYMRDTEEVLFIDNEDVINHVRKLLSEKYILIEEPVARIFKCGDEEDDFEYFDIELKLILDK